MIDQLLRVTGLNEMKKKRNKVCIGDEKSNNDDDSQVAQAIQETKENNGGKN